MYCFYRCHNKTSALLIDVFLLYNIDFLRIFVINVLNLLPEKQTKMFMLVIRHQLPKNLHGNISAQSDPFLFGIHKCVLIYIYIFLSMLFEKQNVYEVQFQNHSNIWNITCDVPGKLHFFQILKWHLHICSENKSYNFLIMQTYLSRFYFFHYIK